MKTCKGCGRTMSYDEFYRNPNVRDGHLNWCKKCTMARYRPLYREKQRQLIAWLAQIKLERGCADCGYREHAAALDFDHLPGLVKEHQVGVMTAGMKREKILAEIAKCEVVCANCHRIRTAERRDAEKARANGRSDAGNRPDE